MSFSKFDLSEPIIDAVTKQGYEYPTPIQKQSIPVILSGRDVLAAAQTGTGKTAGFTLPVLELLSEGKSASSNQARTLVLTPTRELAIQVSESVKCYGCNLSLKSVVVYGGVKINPQMMKLRKGADVLIATPGRLLDLYQQNAVKFNNLEILILDEADKMLDMGFLKDIRKILALLPKRRQNLLFSATLSREIKSLAKEFVIRPVEIAIKPDQTTAQSVTQWMYPVDKKQKIELLKFLIKENNWQQVLVFSRTKHGANKIVKKLQADDLNAIAIHGNKSQGARTKALLGFKSGEFRILVATDIASRGLDIHDLPHVINLDLPNVAEDYVHRIGRTGRAGKKGEAISLVSADEFQQLRDIENLIQQEIPRKLIDGFEPDHDVPASVFNNQPDKKEHIKKNRNKKKKFNASKSTNQKEQRRGKRRTPKSRKTSRVKSSQKITR